MIDECVINKLYKLITHSSINHNVTLPILLVRGLKQSWVNASCSDRNTRDYRDRDSHTGFFAHGNSKGEDETGTGVLRNLENRNVGTKGKSPKQGLARAEDLTIDLPNPPPH